MKLTDQMLYWQGFGSAARNLPEHGQWESWCHLRIYQHHSQHIVVFTESRSETGAYYNPGTSITNASENIAMMVAKAFDLSPATTLWIEHYEPISDTEETFDRVEYDWAGLTTKPPPHWKHLGRAAAEQLVGEPL